MQLTKTADVEAQYKGIVEILEHYEKEYKKRLEENSFNNYSCFAEYLNMEEPPAYHHHVICQKLQEVEAGDCLRLAITTCAGSGKTEYASRRFAAWCMGRRKVKWLQAGYNATFATNELGKKTKAYILTDEYRNIFGDVVLKTDQRAGDKWALSNGSEYTAKGAKAGIAGVRASFGAIDDLYPDLATALNPAYRDEVFRWYLADFTSRLLPRAPIVMCNTRWHSDDAIGRVIIDSKAGKIIPFEVINIKALSELGDENDPLGRTKPDMSVWPEYYSAEHYINLRNTLTGSMWSSLYQGVPVDETGGLVKSDWFRRYTGDVRKDPNITKRRITLSVDTAQTANERADFTAITVWLESSTGLHYLLDVIRDKLEFPEMCSLIDKTAERWDVNAVLVEAKGSGLQYIQTRQGKTTVPIISISTNNNSKEFRFDAVSPLFEAGLVYLPEKAPWLSEYERELMAFPNAKHDDQVDSSSQYLEWARGRQRKGGTVKLHGYDNEATRHRKQSMVETAIQKEMEQKRKDREKPASPIP